MPLNTDYRPKSFDEMLGNKAAILSLRSIYERESDWPHSVLIQGPKGCGKSTLGRIISTILLGKSYEKAGNDFVQVDGGDVDAEFVRRIKDQVKFKPMGAKCRIWLFEEAHMIGRGATEKNIPQNNLLTLLEEPPNHVYFILCTTDPQRLVSTIRSRCHIFEVQYLKDFEIVDLLSYVLEKENITDISNEILKKIAIASEGCPRDSLKILDQIIDMSSEEEMQEAINSFNYNQKQVSDLCKALLGRQSWNRVREIIKNMDLSNPEQSRRAVLGWMGGKLLKGDDPTAAIIYDSFEKPLYDVGKSGFIIAAYKALLD